MAKHWALNWAVCLFLSSPSLAQLSGPDYQKAGILQGNSVKTTFGNWGVIGQPATMGNRGAWRFSSNGYIGDMSIFLGLEFPMKDFNGDSVADLVHSVITCSVSRPSLGADVDPVTGASWTFEPDSGYSHAGQSSPAIHSVPATWPLLWPNHPEWGTGRWNGMRGPDSTTGDDEAYFRMDDRNDLRFSFAANNARRIVFHPDSTDTTRTGQGISVDVRYIESADPRFQDILYRVYDIINEGTTNYPKAVFGTLTGTYIGGTSIENYNEYNNDASAYFASSDFILSWNVPENAVRNPAWQGPVGKFGEAFVETPSGNQIASYNAFSPAGSISFANDEDLWSRLRPGRFVNPSNIVNDTVALAGSDMDYLYGSHYFPLAANTTARVAAVLVFGYQKDEIAEKILLAKALWNSGFDKDRVFNSVTFSNFPYHRFLSGMQAIEWSTDPAASSVSIWYSPDAGAHWLPMALNTPNTGSLMCSTQDFPDAAFGQFRIVAADSAGRIFGFQKSGHYCTVNNHNTHMPFVRIVDSTISYNALVAESVHNIPLLAGTPAWDSLDITLYYRIEDKAPFVAFESYRISSDTALQLHPIAFEELPNSPSFQLKVVASGSGGSFADSTAFFIKETPRPPVPASFLRFVGGAQVPVDVAIVDSSRVRNDHYVITFCDTAFAGPKTFSVRDSTMHTWVAKDAPLLPDIETAPFDGLSIHAKDFVTAMDSAKTRWARADTTTEVKFSASVLNVSGLDPTLRGYRQPSDYRIVFYDGIVDTSAPFGLFGLPAMPVQFKVYDMKTQQKVKLFAVGSNNYVEAVFLENVCGVEWPTWDVVVSSQMSMPHAGDTVYFVTKKGLSIYDTLLIQGITLAAPRANLAASEFALQQNYPNPFNPGTTIEYTIAGARGQGSGVSEVRLRVYDVLGRQVAELVNARQAPGKYRVTFDATRVATGVYFYRLTAGSFSEVRKMAFIK